MDPITYTEFGTKTIIKEVEEVGNALTGMRSGKPFTENGALFINLDKKMHKILDVSFEDEDGNELSREDVSLDTTTYVIGVIVNNSSVLLIKRSKPDFTYYVFPGGHVRENETLEEAFEREMREETDIEVSRYGYTLELQQHKEGFGPENAFFVEMNEKDLKFKDQDPDDSTSKMFFHPIDKLDDFENLFPNEVAEVLKEKYLK